MDFRADEKGHVWISELWRIRLANYRALAEKKCYELSWEAKCADFVWIIIISSWALRNFWTYWASIVDVIMFTGQGRTETGNFPKIFCSPGNPIQKFACAYLESRWRTISHRFNLRSGQNHADTTAPLSAGILSSNYWKANHRIRGNASLKFEPA